MTSAFHPIPERDQVSTIRPYRNFTYLPSSRSLEKLFPRDSKEFLFSSDHRYLSLCGLGNSLKLASRFQKALRTATVYYRTCGFSLRVVSNLASKSTDRLSAGPPNKISFFWPTRRARLRKRRKDADQIWHATLRSIFLLSSIIPWNILAIRRTILFENIMKIKIWLRWFQKEILTNLKRGIKNHIKVI